MFEAAYVFADPRAWYFRHLGEFVVRHSTQRNPRRCYKFLCFGHCQAAFTYGLIKTFYFQSVRSPDYCSGVRSSDYLTQGQIMLKVNITSNHVHLKSGVSSKTGKPYEIREQEVWVHLFDRDGKPNPYPSSVLVTLERDQPAYNPGEYTIHPSSFYANGYKQLAMRLRLQPGKLQAAA
jgi:hypothetical protein